MRAILRPSIVDLFTDADDSSHEPEDLFQYPALSPFEVTKASETLPTLKKSALKVSPSKLTSDLYASIVLQ